MGNYFGYLRISTKEERDLQKYSRQESALQKYAEKEGIEFLYVAKEDESGKSFLQRKEWQKIEKMVHSGDTIVFKDLSRFTREAENGYEKYMELVHQGINLIFLDNPTVCTNYIKQLAGIAERQNIVTRISVENTIRLLLIVELDRAEQERLTLVKRIKDGIAASQKKSGRPKGKLDKMTPELERDIRKYLADRTIRQVDLIKKYSLSRNTLKKYIEIIKKEN